MDKLDRLKFTQLLSDLQQRFSIKIDYDQSDSLYQDLKCFHTYQVTHAIKRLCEETERLTKGINLYAVILKYIDKNYDPRKVLGWECPKCQKTNKLIENMADNPNKEDGLCDCELKCLEPIDKKNLLETLRALGLKEIVKNLESRKDEVPF